MCICPTDSHEAILPLALLQRVFNEAAQFEEEQLFRRLGRAAGPFGLTILFTQRLGPGVACTQRGETAAVKSEEERK